MSKRKRARPKIPPKALRDIWQKIPSMVDCKGKCASSCGPVPSSKIESDLMAERSGQTIGVQPGTLTCNLLTKDGLCSVYSLRPMMCRIWGTTKKLECPFGCKPERWLSDREVADIYRQIEALDGDEDSGRAVERMMLTMTPMQRSAWKKAKREWDEENSVIGGLDVH